MFACIFCAESSILETVQNFFYEFGTKPRLPLVENIISFCYIMSSDFKPTKIINRANKNWAYFQMQSVQKNSIIKVGLHFNIIFIKHRLIYSLQKDLSLKALTK